jgi:uroporphyrinogen-III synthase
MADNIQDINAKYISIGDVTSRTAENLGIKISRTAEKSTVGGIIQVILESEKER